MVCNFVANCKDGEEEAQCPAFYDFDDCDDRLEDCHWNEMIGDPLDWVTALCKLIFLW